MKPSLMVARSSDDTQTPIWGNKRRGLIAKARRALRECVCEGMRRGRKRECERERECVSKVGGLEGLEEESWKNPPQTARCWTPGDAGRIITVAVDTAVTGRGAPVGGFPGRGLAGQHLARYYFFLPGWAPSFLPGQSCVGGPCTALEIGVTGGHGAPRRTKRQRRSADVLQDWPPRPQKVGRSSALLHVACE